MFLEGHHALRLHHLGSEKPKSKPSAWSIQIAGIVPFNHLRSPFRLIPD